MICSRCGEPPENAFLQTPTEIICMECLTHKEQMVVQIMLAWSRGDFERLQEIEKQIERILSNGNNRVN